jgi:branched-chain amino acid transport system substrate-binding protein
VVGSTKVVSEAVKAFRAAGSHAQVVALSTAATKALITNLGPQARGVIVTQVVPDTRYPSLPVVKEALDLAKAAGLAEISSSMMEGYMAAKVLVEGLRRAGHNPTRASLMTALNSMQRFDLGGLEIKYSPQDHTGLDFVDISIVNDLGKFLR